MKTESCRDRRASLGAYALGHLPEEERAALEAHLEGCPDCRAEVDSLLGVAKLLPFGDPAHFGPAPTPSAALGSRIAATIAAERRQERRQTRRRRFAWALSGATATAAAVLAIVLWPGGGDGAPDQYVEFTSVPSDVKMAALLEPHPYGTEIRMYVKGISSGTLCRVSLRGANGATVPAGTFRYRWGDDSQAVLTSALDLSRTVAIKVEAGGRTFVAPVEPEAVAIELPAQEDKT
ncbi:MAG TPA: zf-HC2 domain-containing protein [Solirubrobacterales bacterium]|nr:zf-HC2 domain-containing protein [Solirubrobacterales bacterium]